MVFPFGDCKEEGQHQGQIKWKPYPPDLDGPFTDGIPRGMTFCTVCEMGVDYAVPKPGAKERRVHGDKAKR